MSVARIIWRTYSQEYQYPAVVMGKISISLHFQTQTPSIPRNGGTHDSCCLLLPYQARCFNWLWLVRQRVLLAHANSFIASCKPVAHSAWFSMLSAWTDWSCCCTEPDICHWLLSLSPQRTEGSYDPIKSFRVQVIWRARSLCNRISRMRDRYFQQFRPAHNDKIDSFDSLDVRKQNNPRQGILTLWIFF
jgi:hypothetical protein